MPRIHLAHEAGLLLFETILGPFVFVNDEAIEESRGLIRFELAVFFQEWRGQEQFVIGQPLAGVCGARGMLEDGDRQAFTADFGRAGEDVEGLAFAL